LHFTRPRVSLESTRLPRWYRKAAEQGHAGGQCDLGFMYENGQGAKHNHAEAVRWYQKSAEQGHAGGQSNLGFMYANGLGE